MLLDEHPTKHLAYGRFGQNFTEFDMFWHLVGGKLLATPAFQLVGIERTVFAQHHLCLDRFALVIVGDTGHSGFKH